MLDRILIFYCSVFVYYVLIGLINLTRECRDRRYHLDFYSELDIKIAAKVSICPVELHPVLGVKTGIQKMNTDDSNKIDSTTSNQPQSEPIQTPKTIEIDGSRPVDPSSIEVYDTLNIDGNRPIASAQIEVYDTLNVDGQRPIAASNLNTDHTLDIDGKRPIDPSSIQVHHTVDIDGERPVTSSDFEVKDTLDIDGQRPIASTNSEKPEFIKDFID